MKEEALFIYTRFTNYTCTVRATTRTGYIVTSSNFTKWRPHLGTRYAYFSSFLGLEVLFSHSTLGTLPLNNEESIECGKHGVCEEFHEVLYVKPLKLGGF